MNAMRAHGIQSRKVKVQRKELVEKLKKNKQVHLAEYSEACGEFRTATVRKLNDLKEECDRLCDKCCKGKEPALAQISYRPLDIPQCYAKAYDQIILMMEMSVDDVVELSTEEFACFVMDEWDWKEDFAGTKMSYSR